MYIYNICKLFLVYEYVTSILGNDANIIYKCINSLMLLHNLYYTCISYNDMVPFGDVFADAGQNDEATGLSHVLQTAVDDVCSGVTWLNFY